jgi:hypothetical protein
MPRKNTLTLEGVTAAMRELYAFDPTTQHLKVRHDLLARWANSTQQLALEHFVDIRRKRGREWLVNDAVRRIRRRAAVKLLEALAEHGIKRALLIPQPSPYGKEPPLLRIPESMKPGKS